MRFISVIFKKTQVLVIFTIVITTVVYSNSLFNGFVWDDGIFIKEWPLVRTFKGLPYILKGAYPSSDSWKYRPVKGVVLIVDHKFFGLDPFYYHLQGLLIHVLTTVLVYFVIKNLIIKIINLRFTDIQTNMAAFFGAVLFGVHPIHVEAITFITSSTDILGITFLLASFYYYLRQENFGKKLTKYYYFSLIFAFLAYITNEMTLILFLILALYSLCFKPNLKFYYFKLISPFLFLVFLLLFLRYFVFKIGNYSDGYFADSFITNMLLMPKVIFKYILISFWPIGLNVNHNILDGNLALRYVDFNPEYARKIVLSNPEVYLSILFIAVLVFIPIYFYRRAPTISFLIGLFFISLLPVINIIPVNILFAERYAYLASFAVSFGLGIAFVLLLRLDLLGLLKRKQQILIAKRFYAQTIKNLLLIFLFIGLLVFYSVQTFMRNFDWRSEETLWLKTVSQVPESTIAHNDLGVAYLESGRTEQALPHLETANRISNVYFGKISINLAKAYIRLGMYDKAIEHLNLAISRSPGNWSGYAYLGEVYFRLGKLNKALDNYNVSLINNPNYYDSRIGIAGILISQNKHDKALEHLFIAQSINPYIGASYNNIALVYYKQNKISEAKNVLVQGIKITRDNKLVENLQKISEKNEINVVTPPDLPE